MSAQDDALPLSLQESTTSQVVEYSRISEDIENEIDYDDRALWAVRQMKPSVEVIATLQHQQIHSLGKCVERIFNETAPAADSNNSLLGTLGGWMKLTNSNSEETVVTPVYVPPPQSADQQQFQPVKSTHFQKYISGIASSLALYQVAKNRVNEKPKFINGLEVVTNEKGVPEEFFSDDFDMCNLFSRLFDNDQLSSAQNIEKNLLDYHTEVDIVLKNQVVFHSKGIMDALVEYNAIHHQLSVAHIYIRSLRNRMKDFEEQALCRPLMISLLHRRLNNLKAVNELLASAVIVHQNMSTLKLLLSENNFVDAIEAIETIQLSIGKIDQIHRFKNIEEGLKQEQMLIQKALEQEFMKVVMLLQYEESEDKLNTLLQSKMTPIVNGLLKTRRLLPVLRICNEEMKRYTTEIIKITWDKAVSRHSTHGMDRKRSLQNVLMSASPMSPVSSADRISNEQYLEAAEEMFNIVYSTFNKVTLLSQTICEYCKNDEVVADVMNKIVSDTITTCDSICATLINVKSSEVGRMSRKNLLSYMSQFFGFVEMCEKMMKKEMTAVRSTLLQHGQLYLISFTTQNIQLLQTVLDNEIWMHIDKVPPEFQELINRFTMTDLPVDSSKSTMHLEIHGRKFPTINSFIILLKILRDFIDLDTPTFHFINIVDLTQTLYKILIQYNHKIMLLILHGGAANEQTGIRSITTQHLLLAYESLHCLIHLVPYIQRMLEAKLEDKQQQANMTKFDNFIELLKIHQGDITKRIINLTQERINDQLQQAQKFKWDSAPIDQETPLNILMKNFVYTFSVIDLYLGEHKMEQIQIMTPIVQYLLEKLTLLIESVTKKMGKKSKGRDRLKHDCTPIKLLLNDSTNREKYASEVNLSDFENAFHKAFGSI